jgi:hypothetical protein
MEEADRGREREDEAGGRPAALAVHRCRRRLKGRGRRRRREGPAEDSRDGRRPVKWEEGDKKEREKGEGLTCGPTSGWLGWRRNMKDDECGRSKYKGENMGE